MKSTQSASLCLELIAALVMALASPGCRSTKTTLPNREILSEAELHDILIRYASTFSRRVAATADHISNQSSERKIKRACVDWKLRAIPPCREASVSTDPRTGFLDIWALSIQMQEFLETGGAKEAFGDQQQRAIETATSLVMEMNEIASQLLSEEAVAEARQSIEEYIRSQSGNEGFQTQESRPSRQLVKFGSETFSWAFQIPLSPFKALSGIDVGAQAIKEFTVVADRIRSFAEEVPSYARWEAELLFYEIEESPQITRFNQSVQGISEAAVSMAETVDRLPEMLRLEIDSTLNKIEEKQTGIQATLNRAQVTVENVRSAIADSNATVEQIQKAMADGEQLLAKMEPVAGSLERTTANVESAGKAWNETLSTFNTTLTLLNDDGNNDEEGAQPSAPEDPNEPSLTIVDYGDAAQKFGEAAVNLRAMLGEFNSMVASDALSQKLDQVEARAEKTVDYTGDTTRTLLNAAFWRALAIVAAIFGAAVAYRLIFRRRV